MKVGDLICYNAFGQKWKTLGMVLDIIKVDRLGARWISCTHKARPGVFCMALILWSKISKTLPKRYSRPKGPKEWNYQNSRIFEMPVVGQLVWHEAGPWFEVIDET